MSYSHSPPLRMEFDNTIRFGLLSVEKRGEDWNPSAMVGPRGRHPIQVKT